MAFLDGIGAEMTVEVTFVYNRTFIVEAPVLKESGTYRRSVSQPPPTTRLETACDAMTEEETLRGYVRSLGISSMRSICPDVGESLHAPRRHKAADRPVVFWQESCGSRGHPDLCKRPCIYFVAGKCTTGMHCSYCHMEHNDRPAKLDKQQRHKFNLMGMREALLMLHGMLTSSAKENGFLPLARNTLGLVEEEAMKHDVTEVTSSEAVYRRLERVLVRMPFHQLALLAVSKADSSEFGELMVTSIEKLTDDLEDRRKAGLNV
ncbi:strG [Symbiodinium sp. CCMP2592]|nr:strG [Symbiodinium sp. CCMP2592]